MSRANPDHLHVYIDGRHTETTDPHMQAMLLAGMLKASLDEDYAPVPQTLAERVISGVKHIASVAIKAVTGNR